MKFDRDRNGYFYTNPSWRIPLPQLSEGELLALFLAERLLHQYRGTPFAADISRVFQKITAMLPDSVTLNMDQLAQAYTFRVQNTDAGEPKQFRALLQAVERRRRLELIYWSASRDETLRRLVDPYHLAAIDGDWFLIAYCHLREEVRTFSPGHIRELKETGVTFDPPADFRATDYLDAGFRKVRGTGPGQTVRLRFNPVAARWVREKTWHASQTLEEHADGSLTLTFAVNHLAEVKRWVLSFGAECEVLGPEELIENISRDVLGMIARLNYAGKEKGHRDAAD